jgi:hypothetical protein
MKITYKLKLASTLFPAIYLVLIWLYVISLNYGGNLPIAIWQMAALGALISFTTAYSIVMFIIELLKTLKSN